MRVRLAANSWTRRAASSTVLTRYPRTVRACVFGIPLANQLVETSSRSSWTASSTTSRARSVIASLGGRRLRPDHRRPFSSSGTTEPANWHAARRRRWSVAASPGLQSQRSGADPTDRPGATLFARRIEVPAQTPPDISNMAGTTRSTTKTNSRSSTTTIVWSSAGRPLPGAISPCPVPRSRRGLSGCTTGTPPACACLRHRLGSAGAS